MGRRWGGGEVDGVGGEGRRGERGGEPRLRLVQARLQLRLVPAQLRSTAYAGPNLTGPFT